MKGKRHARGKGRSGVNRPRTVEEKIGQIWAFIFIGVVISLVVTLVGKGCFFTG